MTDTKSIFSKSEHFYDFQNGEGRTPLSSLVACLWVWLNMHQYPWIFRLCQGSEYAWSSYIFDRLLTIPPVLNKPGFWIWRSCIYKGYAESQYIWYAPYTSIMTEYASTCLNVPQYTWIWLNIAECLLICLIIPGQTLLTMPGFSICHNIIIITSLLQPLLN